MMPLRNATLSSLCFLLLAGCNLADLSSPDGRHDAPTDGKDAVPSVSEQDYWDQLAKSADAGVFETTDELVSTVDKLKKTGELKDVSRVDEVRKKRIELIQQSEREKVSKILRGAP